MECVVAGQAVVGGVVAAISQLLDWGRTSAQLGAARRGAISAHCVYKSLLQRIFITSGADTERLPETINQPLPHAWDQQ